MEEVRLRIEIVCSLYLLPSMPLLLPALSAQQPWSENGGDGGGEAEARPELNCHPRNPVRSRHGSQVTGVRWLWDVSFLTPGTYRKHL